MTDAQDLLTAQLWDLRGQLEAQLRCVTTIQRLHERLAPGGTPQRMVDRHELATDMGDIVTMNAAVRGIALEALDAINAIPD